MRLRFYLPFGQRPLLGSPEQSRQGMALMSAVISGLRLKGAYSALAGGSDVQFRPDRHDAGIHQAQVVKIVLFDGVQPNRLRNAGIGVETPGVSPQFGLIDQPPEVGAQGGVVDGVEAHQRGEQVPVTLRLALAQEIRP